MKIKTKTTTELSELLALARKPETGDFAQGVRAGLILRAALTKIEKTKPAWRMGMAVAARWRGPVLREELKRLGIDAEQSGISCLSSEEFHTGVIIGVSATASRNTAQKMGVKRGAPEYRAAQASKFKKGFGWDK